MTKCPICDKKLDWQGSSAYNKHIRDNHRLYWLKSRKLGLLANSTLIISIVLTLLVATVLYSPDSTGYSVIGLATLFLALSVAFNLRQRGLPKKYRKGSKREEMKREGKHTRGSRSD